MGPAHARSSFTKPPAHQLLYCRCAVCMCLMENGETDDVGSFCVRFQGVLHLLYDRASCFCWSHLAQHARPAAGGRPACKLSRTAAGRGFRLGMGAPLDLQYIGSVLAGEPGAAGQPWWESRRSRSRCGGSSSGRMGAISGGGGGAGASGSAGNFGGACLSDHVAAPPGIGAEVAGSRGGEGGRRRCELCDCWVTSGTAGWDTHAAGIRHRRQASAGSLSARRDDAPRFGVHTADLQLHLSK